MYRKATPTAGVLIRKVIRLLRQHLPPQTSGSCLIDSHILIACSSGADSTALAHLLIHYGRKIADPENITLLYIDHGWRRGAKREALAVKRWAKEWGVRCVTKTLPKQWRPFAAKRNGTSVEALAREGRKRVYEQVSKAVGAKHVLTAHTADDVAETMLWRLASSGRVDGGIHVVQGNELRPFIDVWKKEILDYLKESKQKWFEDPTNRSRRLLRSRIRHQCMPALEAVFPRVKHHLHAWSRNKA